MNEEKAGDKFSEDDKFLFELRDRSLVRIYTYDTNILKVLFGLITAWGTLKTADAALKLGDPLFVDFLEFALALTSFLISITWVSRKNFHRRLDGGINKILISNTKIDLSEIVMDNGSSKFEILTERMSRSGGAFTLAITFTLTVLGVINMFCDDCVVQNSMGHFISNSDKTS